MTPYPRLGFCKESSRWELVRCLSGYCLASDSVDGNVPDGTFEAVVWIRLGELLETVGQPWWNLRWSEFISICFNLSGVCKRKSRRL